LAATDRETNEMDAFSPQTAEPSQEVPEWLISRLQSSKYCTYCQSFMDGWSDILNGECSNDLEDARYPYH
jgi:hypothetical protein